MRIYPPSFTLFFIAVAFSTPFASAHAANTLTETTNSNTENPAGINRAATCLRSPVQVTVTNALCTDSGSITLAHPGVGLCSYALVDSSKATIANGVLQAGQAVVTKVAAGAYIVNLNDNVTGATFKNITVTGATMALPLAAFQVTAGYSLVAITQAETGEEIFLTAAIGNRASYLWQFGNGAVDSDAVASTVYKTAGQYLITLAVKNAVGCTITMAQTITVTDAPAAIQNVADNNNPAIWSDKNVVYVNLGSATDVNATINIYDMLGRQISSQRSAQPLYQLQVNNIEAGYFIVSVYSNNKITTKKVFIGNMN